MSLDAPDPWLQRTRWRSPLSRQPLGVTRPGIGLAVASLAALGAAVVALGACGKAESVVTLKTEHGFSETDSRTRNLTPPMELKPVELVVPEGCRTGEVGVRFVFEATVTEAGNVETLELRQPAAEAPECPGLEAAVRKALSQSKYEPTVIDGRPARVVLTINTQIDAR